MKPIKWIAVIITLVVAALLVACPAKNPTTRLTPTAAVAPSPPPAPTSPAPVTKTCPQCGREYGPDKDFCNYCGPPPVKLVPKGGAVAETGSPATGAAATPGGKKPAPPRGDVVCRYYVEPNPASIPEEYTVYYVFDNGTADDVKVAYITDGETDIVVGRVVRAGREAVLYSASGTTYTPGTFHHSPILFHTDAGTFRAPDYDFVVR